MIDGYVWVLEFFNSMVFYVLLRGHPIHNAALKHSPHLFV